MTQSEIIENLRTFSPGESGDWTAFIDLLDKLWATKKPQKAYSTLFDLLIKFEDDYMECQWGIIHGMEHFGDYESELLATLSKKPVDMTITMLSRVINSGEHTLAGVNIEAILEGILQRADVSGGLKDFSRDCMARLNAL